VPLVKKIRLIAWVNAGSPGVAFLWPIVVADSSAGRHVRQLSAPGQNQPAAFAGRMNQQS
jgi:hypothetical protein